jgi:P-type E1-E2 ATPase
MGRVQGDTVAVGSRSFVTAHLGAEGRAILASAIPEGLQAYVAINGAFAGIITYADQLRTGVDAVLSDLRALGIRQMLLLTGDHPANAKAVADAVGITDVRGDMTPEDKVTVIRKLATQSHDVLMVGDGTNDAPALSTAAVGVALAGHGGGVTAEAADVVVLVDDLSRLPDAIRISQRTMAIARQSMVAGLVLSGMAMLIAAAGYIPAIAGALLQEVIDVAVIINALRASTLPAGGRNIAAM